MPRRRLVLLAAVAALGCVGVLLAMGARIPQGAILAELERALGYPIDVDHARVRLVPQPALELVDVRAPNAGVVAGCVARFEAQRVRLRVAFGPLLWGRAVVDRMDVEAPLVRLLRPATAQPGDDASARAAERAPRNPQPGPPSVQRAPLPIPRRPDGADVAVVRLRRIEVHQGRVQFLDEASGSRWAVGRMRATVRLPPDPALQESATVELRTTLRRGGREALAELTLDGRLAWDGRGASLRADLDSGPFGFGPLRIDGGSARLFADRRGAHLRDLELEIGGGTVTGRARTLLGSDASVALALAGAGDGLQDAFGEGEVVVGGAWDTQLAVHGPAPWRSHARRGLRGHGRLTITDGSITPFELGSALLDVLAPLRGRAQSQQLRARYPDLFDEQRLAFSRLGGTFRIDGRRVRTSDLLLRGDAYRAAGRGFVSVDGRLGLGVRLTLSEALTQDLLGRSGLAAAVGAVPGRGLMVPLRLEGTVTHPRVKARPEWSRALIRRTLGGSGMGDLLERLLH